MTSVGKGLTDALPNAPDISNPKAASGKPTVGKLTKGSNPVKVGNSTPLAQIGHTFVDIYIYSVKPQIKGKDVLETELLLLYCMASQASGSVRKTSISDDLS